MKRIAASFKPKTESKAAQIVAALLDHCGHCGIGGIKIDPKALASQRVKKSRLSRLTSPPPKASFYPSGGPSSM